MNLRQKAKHFKKLYESTLPKKPYPVIYATRSGKHYKVHKAVDEREMVYTQLPPQLFKTHIENSILEELRPVIWDSVKVEKDVYADKTIFSLDVWM